MHMIIVKIYQTFYHFEEFYFTIKIINNYFKMRRRDFPRKFEKSLATFPPNFDSVNTLWVQLSVSLTSTPGDSMKRIITTSLVSYTEMLSSFLPQIGSWVSFCLGAAKGSQPRDWGKVFSKTQRAIILEQKGKINTTLVLCYLGLSI